jgi:hypothetical protein
MSDDITVLASFGMPSRIKPLSFTWSGRTIEIREVTYTWKTKEGQKYLHHFSVTDGNTLLNLPSMLSLYFGKLNRSRPNDVPYYNVHRYGRLLCLCGAAG